MPNPFFRFKQFTIRHDRCAMKVGTDGVLLGAWASLQAGTEGRENGCLRVLDIGTGTGLIALMLAQRFPLAQIEGIDIDDEAVLQAKENVGNSPFGGRIAITKKDFIHIDAISHQYDLIVSNPPFYQEDIFSGNLSRDIARHTASLPFEILVKNVAKLLCEAGTFCVIIPYAEAVNFIAMCAEQKLYLACRLDIQSTAQKQPKRTMLAFTYLTDSEADSSTMILYEKEGNRTSEYSELTKDFYL